MARGSSFGSFVGLGIFALIAYFIWTKLSATTAGAPSALQQLQNALQSALKGGSSGAKGGGGSGAGAGGGASSRSGASNTGGVGGVPDNTVSLDNLSTPSVIPSPGTYVQAPDQVPDLTVAGTQAPDISGLINSMTSPAPTLDTGIGVDNAALAPPPIDPSLLGGGGFDFGGGGGGGGDAMDFAMEL